jgi:hypothetical protein
MCHHQIMAQALQVIFVEAQQLLCMRQQLLVVACFCSCHHAIQTICIQASALLF